MARTSVKTSRTATVKTSRTSSPRKSADKATGKGASSATGAQVPAVMNRYDAGGNGRRMRGWNAPSSGPNKAIESAPKVRDRAHDALRNDWSGSSFRQNWTTNLVGVGIVPRLRTKNKTLKEKINKLWRNFCDQSDADGILDFYGQQTLAVGTWIGAGEVFTRLRPRRLNSGLKVPLQVQLIEPDFCPQFDADYWPGMVSGNRIRQGVELDRVGRRVAHWMYREHPGDFHSSGLIDKTRLVRVPIEECRSMFEPKRPGQLRGVSEMAPILARLRTVGDYDDAVLERQRIANLFVAFIEMAGIGPNGTIDPLTGKPIEYDKDDTPMAGLEPGTVHKMLPGEKMSFANPPEPGTMYHEYMRTQNMGTSAGGGLPYELFSGDIKEVSDRTLRVVINNFRRFAEQRQWQIIIPQHCKFIYRQGFLPACVLAGHITMSEMEEAAEVLEWAPHGWEYIHPVQDAQGKKIEVDAGFRSRSSVISGRGEDPDAVDDERQQDVQREKDLGIWVDPNASAGNKKSGTEEDGIDDSEYPQNPKAPSAKLEDALVDRAKAEAEMFRAQAEAARNGPTILEDEVVRDPITGLMKGFRTVPTTANH